MPRAPLSSQDANDQAEQSSVPSRSNDSDVIQRMARIDVREETAQEQRRIASECMQTPLYQLSQSGELHQLPGDVEMTPDFSEYEYITIQYL